jgi:hypothetical protein
MDELEKRLNYGERFGFIRKTDNPDVLSWVILSKRKLLPVAPFDPVQERERFLHWVAQTEVIQQHPYFVAIIEQERAIYETGEYEGTEEFGQKESYYFRTLEETSTFLEASGFQLEYAKTASDIGAP